MDWFISDMDTNMWLYPRGLERVSNTKTPLTWTSKFGSRRDERDRAGRQEDTSRQSALDL
jgi:hypothetical protein